MFQDFWPSCERDWTSDQTNKHYLWRPLFRAFFHWNSSRISIGIITRIPLKSTQFWLKDFFLFFNFFCRYLGDLNQDKTITKRVADAIFNPLSSTIFTIVAIPLVIAAVYWLFVVNGPTPVVKVKLLKL